MFVNIRNSISNNLLNFFGYSSNKKIIVIESDDWGSIQTPSLDTLKSLAENGCVVKHPYYLYDSLATEDDLSCLFEVLSGFKDSKGNSPVITANTIVANPNFDRIRNSNFTQYYFEPFTETLKNYKNCENSFKLWQEGINCRIWHPQFHGREHLNVLQWMIALKNNDKVTRMAFENNMFSIGEDSGIKIKGGTYMRALSEPEPFDYSKIINQGLELFREIFGYNSLSFIAPAYTWNEDIERHLSCNGVRFLQGIFRQSYPLCNGKFKNKYHYIGQRNEHDQIYLLRNVFFEPTLNPSFDWVSNGLKRISIAFKWRKPATISTHRLNFIGSLNIKNRDKNLKLFIDLLKEIVKHWPDVVFLTSDQLGEIISIGDE